MTGRKFTDEEVIKALECCSKDNVKDCDACPYVDIETRTYCVNELIKDTLDLINRKNAEIERLKEENKFHRKTVTENAQRALEVTLEEIAKAESEAIKEFGKMLIDKSKNGIISICDILDYVKEMTEGNDE